MRCWYILSVCNEIKFWSLLFRFSIVLKVGYSVSLELYAIYPSPQQGTEEDLQGSGEISDMLFTQVR